MSDGNVVGFITVRSTSTRLPGKCFLPFGDGNLIEHVIRRTAAFAIEPVVCTTTESADDRIAGIAASEGARCFRGSTANKLKRWADCAMAIGTESFHTIDADDPFFDADEVRRSMTLLASKALDVVAPTLSSSNGGASVGYSLTADVVRRGSQGLDDATDTEMMWHYLENVPGVRTETLSEPGGAAPQARLTLDYEEDYWLLESVRRIVGNLAPRREIDELFRKNPDLHKVNWFRNQQWKSGQLAKTPTHDFKR